VVFVAGFGKVYELLMGEKRRRVHGKEVDILAVKQAVCNGLSDALDIELVVAAVSAEDKRVLRYAELAA
jgi:hypothetical protein